MALKHTNQTKLEIEDGIFLKENFYLWVNIISMNSRKLSDQSTICEFDVSLEFYRSKEEKSLIDQTNQLSSTGIKRPFYAKILRINSNDENFKWSKESQIDTYSTLIFDICSFLKVLFSEKGVEVDIVDLN